MGTEKRARQKSNRQAAIDHARSEAERNKRHQRVITYGAIGLVGVFFIGLVWFLLTRGDDDVVSNEPPPVDSTLPTDETTPDPVVIAAPPPGATVTGPTECPPEDGSAERTTTFEQAPPMCIDESMGYEAVLTTTVGDITVQLDPAAAPLATNNFVVLSRYHYYEGVPFHRIINDFMIQGGDATGAPPGTGGPGYTFADELPGPEYVYQPGELAMANSGPDTNGSQFFIVTADAGVDWLAGSHTLFGVVTEGLEVVESIEALDAGDSSPLAAVTIDSVTITETEPVGDAEPAAAPATTAPATSVPATNAPTTTVAATSTTEG
ncbi:MAG: peptidylprolyl isomerase [Acidimicrobiales bacterium]